jgi:hypothetical protein
MSDKKLKITILFKSNQSATFECSSFSVKQAAGKVKSVDCQDPDENYPMYLDLADIDAIFSRKIVDTAGFSKNALGFKPSGV